MMNNVIKFGPLARQNLINNLIFDMTQEIDQFAFFDISHTIEYRKLAADLIESLYMYVNPNIISRGISIASYKNSIQDVLNYCNQCKLPDDFEISDIDDEFIINYRSHLKIAFITKKNSVIRRKFGNFTRLLEASKLLGLLTENVKVPKNIAFVADFDRTQPYTRFEALDIESACRDHISKLLKRLEEGGQLLKIGSNPRGQVRIRNETTKRFEPTAFDDRKWNQIENLIYYVVYELKGKYLNREALKKNGHSSFINAVTGVWKGKYRLPDIYSKLYPLAYDLIPFVILLSMKTGRNESSIFSLKTDCLSKIEDKYFLSYEKQRGKNKLYTMPVSNDGEFSPVKLIQTLISITETLRKHCDEEYKSHLFLGLTIKSHLRDNIKVLDPDYLKFQMNRSGGWCDQNELFDSNDKPIRISLRSLRVFYLSEKYRNHGQLGKVSRDAAHSLLTTTISYVSNESMKESHENAIFNGIQAAKKIAKPLVIVDESMFRITHETHLGKSKLNDILQGKQDVFFASCTDFYNKPGGVENTPCDKPWSCFKCPNAIITRHVLPRVIAFRNFIQIQKEELTTEDWSNKFLSICNIIDQDILPKFPDSVVAECQILSQGELMYYPLTFRA